VRFRDAPARDDPASRPQITVGLLTDVRGFPLQVHALTGNTAETKTMIPVIKAFIAAYRLPGVTVVADAGMMSEANCKDLEDAGLTFIVGARIPDVPYQVAQWRRDHPDQPIPDKQVFVQPTVMGPKADQRKRTIFYQYRTDRAKRTMKGIDTQIGKAEQAVAGKTAVKRNRFVQLTGAKKAVNRDLETKTRALAGLKGYVTNLPEPTPAFVMGAYHQLWQVREELPHVQDRPASPADLPPQTRLHRSPSDHRDGRPRGEPLARARDRLVDQKARPDPTALPQHRSPDRQPHPARRHAPRRRSQGRHRRNQVSRRWTLI